MAKSNAAEISLDYLSGGAQAQGAIAFRGATKWQVLAPGTSGYVLKTNGPNADPSWVAAAVGSVTSVALSGGTTGLTTSGGPITTSGTITLAGTLAVANGGTGSTSASDARTSLGLAIGSNVQAYDATLQSLSALGTAADRIAYTTGLDVWAETGLSAFARSILDDADEATFKATVNLEIGTDVQAYHARLADISGASWAQGDILYHNGSNLVRLPAGTSGYYLKTNGAGANPAWASAVTGAAGSSGQIQYNNAGAFGGAVALAYAASGNLFTSTAQAATDTPVSIVGHASQSAALLAIASDTDSLTVSKDCKVSVSTDDARAFYGSSSHASARAVYGEASHVSGAAIGVYGDANATAGYGVYGDGFYGVYGRSTGASGYGVLGTATAANGVGGLFKASFSSGVGLIAQAEHASAIPAVVKGYTSQSAALQEWRDSSNSVLASVTAAGVFTGNGSGLTNVSASPSDGDKGDITVSSSGSTWTVDNDAVTYAKMQNVSATSRLLGRKTSGAGDPEEVTISEALDFVGSAAFGDILFRGNSGWTRLPAGTNGYYLKTHGTGGTDPEWAPVTASASGSSGQVQYNNAGSLAGAAALAYATNPHLTITAQANASVPLKLIGHATQAVDLFLAQDSGGTYYTKITETGATVVNTNSANAITATSASGRAISASASSDVAVSGDGYRGVAGSSSSASGIGGSFTASSSTGIALLAEAGHASAIPAVIKGYTSQSAKLQEWRNSSDTVLASISSAGVLAAAGATLTGAVDASGATTLKVPVSATPTISANGHFALDTTVTDFSHGLLRYYGGEDLAVVSMPIAQFTAPTDGYVVTYDATNDEFKLAASGGISDGDKGDITVSGSGATWTIDNDVVTYAKLQNVSATSRILGRKSASAGDAEECTLSEILDFVGSAAQGDILYRGASSWARLGAGTAGYFLKTGGAGSNPSWDSATTGVAATLGKITAIAAGQAML